MGAEPHRHRKANGKAEWEGAIGGHKRIARGRGIKAYHRAVRKEYRILLLRHKQGLLQPAGFVSVHMAKVQQGPSEDMASRHKKADSPSCPCGHHTQGGDYITFSCPLLALQRSVLIGDVQC